MPTYIENTEQLTLPLILLRSAVAFPSVTLNFEIADEASIAAAEAADRGNSFALLVSVSGAQDAHSAINPANIASIGTVAKIKQLLKTSDGTVRLITEGYSRAIVRDFHRIGAYVTADVMCKTVAMAEGDETVAEAYLQKTYEMLNRFTSHLPNFSPDLLIAIRAIRNPGQLADFVAAQLLIRPEDKQAVLEVFEPLARVETLISILQKEYDLLLCEEEIQRRVQDNISKNQREYYLREQMHVIQEELGDGAQSEIDEYQERIRKADLPDEVKKKLLKENDRLAQTPFGSAEASVISNYLDICLDLPWRKSSHDRVNIDLARKILDEDHDGLEKVKTRILEFLAVRQLTPELGSQIICLVGPPGVGKTSIAKSVARALHRKYARVSLGGIRDEADIRGHRKTYIGSMPGRLITAISDAGINNPLILLDEIDKMSSGANGDPTSAMLEVLDSEQNKTFRDHFIELPFDLSGCMFIATANSLDNVPRPLIDRMEVIELSSYTKREKMGIAKNHLIPKQLKRHGLTKRNLKISDGAIDEIISYYTREAGVRNLERKIADLCRKSAKKMLEDKVKTVRIDENNVKDFLGARKLLPDCLSETDEVGTVNGLAYTEAGGDMLKVEAAILDGTGKIELTGSLGEVMQESAKIAVSYVRSIAREYGIPTDFYKAKDIHIHFPEGAVPKDGPSAGVTIVTALVSALTGRPVRRDIAMTGEVTLRGNVLAIGGLKEKTMAAYSAGIRDVCIPADNMRDLDEIDVTVREHLHFIPCRRAEEVLSAALLPRPAVIGEEKVPLIPVALSVSGTKPGAAV